MNLTRCNKGHFYDIDRFSQCPHCSTNGVRPNNPTVSLDQAQANIRSDVTVPLSVAAKDIAQSATKPSRNVGEKTISYYNNSLGSEPVVGWLVCIEGNNLGVDYKIKSGRNFIGRAQDMDIAITGDNTVSRERHAAVIYDPKTLKFLVQPGDSKELCYLNDEVVLKAEEISLNDVLTVGSTKLMFFPCCNEKFNWESVKAPEKIG